VFGREIKERKEREREREFAKNYLEIFFFWQNEGLMVIYSEKMTFRLPMHLVRPSATLLTSAILAFSRFNFGRIFEGLHGLRLS